MSTQDPQSHRGVITPPPLALVSQLLRREVIDAERWDSPQTGARRWYLAFAQHPEVVVPFTAHQLRSPEFVNRLARRAPDERLTREDCRRLLRLLHEHVETTGAINPDPFRNDRSVLL